ncbi:putative pectinesterase/pectinesterase inhibitor 26 [Hibiscus syriacus]|uniref:Pectinesterase n=1 Tax=Hibiscus syriacus TaxID=106335 RepID=A0A6A2WD31_HIBSY|nr:pectinesterase 3-like [Hibiscus syriacus]KAE8656213.1 putative pectinesterase/pectinesterase inhibitor 26 [Hibiscus syriacus]
MDSIKSFKGYGKIDEAEERAFKKKTRRRLIVLVISIIVLLAVIIGAVAGTLIHKRNNSSSHNVPPTDLTPVASLKAVCGVTEYPLSCYSSISSIASSNATDPEILFKLSLKVVIDELAKLSQYPKKLQAETDDLQVKHALDICGSLFDDALDRLNDSATSLEVGEGESVLSDSKINDLKTWLSTTITDQETCLDTLEELNTTEHFNATLVQELRAAMQNSTEFASNSLAIVAKILGLLTDFNIPIHRRLLGIASSEFPAWIHPTERRLLQESKPTPNVIVAQDGSGHFKTINEAVKLIGKKNESRFVIYVKEGKYVENVILDKHKWNVMIYGDGKTKTIISGSKNFVDGTPTFDTATFAVAGRGFIAKDIGFENTAGAAKHQAVAMRSQSDRSVFYRSAFDAYQDTLYAHSNRQFYKECDILGTIDFIFGNAAVVFQSCNIMPRQPLPNQFNTITAQGKNDPNQNAGISIQKCTISAFGNLTTNTYLGRPWKEYSTTVIMQSSIGPFLNPVGWREWVTNVDPPSTIFYAEYQNTGPGSTVDKRVKWAGYKSTLSDADAGKFTVATLIQGHDWLPDATVSYEPAL